MGSQFTNYNLLYEIYKRKNYLPLNVSPTYFKRPKTSTTYKEVKKFKVGKIQSEKSMWKRSKWKKVNGK